MAFVVFMERNKKFRMLVDTWQNITKNAVFFLSEESCQILALCNWVCYYLHVVLGIHR